MNIQSAALAGIGLRQPHYRAFREDWPTVGFVEVHSENFFNPHDAAAQVLAAVRAKYTVSLHGVGLALGSACGLDDDHLARLAALVARIEPARVSDHACFARAAGPDGAIVHANDLLPVAFTRGTLAIFCANVQRVQDRLRRPILVENLSSYLDFAERDFSEPGFFAELTRRSGCGLLLDVNNLMVNALNAGADDAQAAVCAWLDELARGMQADAIGEVHLAGHRRQQGLVIDDHSCVVSAPVWQVYAHALRLFGPLPTLVEWDTELPELDVLLGEAVKAQRLLDAEAAARADAARQAEPAA